MKYLTASDNSILKQILDFNLLEKEKQKFLNPTRDFLQYQEWIDSCIKNGFSVLLISSGLECLLQKIKDPEEFYRIHNTNGYLDIAIIAIKKSDEGFISIVPDYVPKESNMYSILPHEDVEWKLCNVLNETRIRLWTQMGNFIHSHAVVLSIACNMTYSTNDGIVEYLDSKYNSIITQNGNIHYPSTQYVSVSENLYCRHIDKAQYSKLHGSIITDPKNIYIIVHDCID